MIPSLLGVISTSSHGLAGGRAGDQRALRGQVAQHQRAVGARPSRSSCRAWTAPIARIATPCGGKAWAFTSAARDRPRPAARGTSRSRCPGRPPRRATLPPSTHSTAVIGASRHLDTSVEPRLRRQLPVVEAAARRWRRAACRCARSAPRSSSRRRSSSGRPLLGCPRRSFDTPGSRRRRHARPRLAPVGLLIGDLAHRPPRRRRARRRRAPRTLRGPGPAASGPRTGARSGPAAARPGRPRCHRHEVAGQAARGGGHLAPFQDGGTCFANEPSLTLKKASRPSDSTW